MTAKTLQSDLEAIVDCGVSVAPVTDWRWYDSAYTERYMQVICFFFFLFLFLFVFLSLNIINIICGGEGEGLGKSLQRNRCRYLNS